MHKFLILLLISIVSISDETYIAWQSDYRLNWTDFKAQPENWKSVVALTASGLTFSYTTKRSEAELLGYEFEVTAHFYPEKSWYIKERVNEVHLRHERLHFDITELHARKFRKIVDNTRFTNNIRSEMNVIYERMNIELDAMQNQYDAETRHSINIEKQRVWERYVEMELDKLSFYK
jgi:hypothetical protein